MEPEKEQAAAVKERESPAVKAALKEPARGASGERRHSAGPKTGGTLMHALLEHLCKQLGDRLRKRRVVLFYDLRREFEPFVDELAPEPGPSAEVERVTIDRLEVHLARFKGSFFAVRFAVEDLAAVDMPDPLLIYLPGAERDRRHPCSWSSKSPGRPMSRS